MDSYSAGYSFVIRAAIKSKSDLLCLQRFLQRFTDPTSSEDENAGLDLNEPLYMQKLEEVPMRGGSDQWRPRKHPISCSFSAGDQISVVGDPVLNVNCLHVQSFDAELYRQLICYPQVTPTRFGHRSASDPRSDG